MTRNELTMGLAALVFVGSMSHGCTENRRARMWGGEMVVTTDRKVVNVTWKENSVWLLTRPVRDGDVNERYEFREHSAYGVAEGKVTVVERGIIASSPKPINKGIDGVIELRAGGAQ